MVERAPIVNIITQLVLVLGLFLLMFPLYVVFVASTLTFQEVNRLPITLIPGDQFFKNIAEVWVTGNFGRVLVNSLIVAAGVTVGKIVFASISAFSIVYFNYRLRALFFWLIFITLMLPLEVRIVPTYAVAANALRPFQEMTNFFGSFAGFSIKLPELNLLNTYAGLMLPLMATATGTFLYRQFYLTVPEELAEAAKMDGAGPLRFYWDHLLPLSRNNMAALAVIMFVYTWNQYLWPLLVVTDQRNFATATMQLQKIVPGPLFGQPPVWNTAMAATLLVMVPPLIVVILLQRWFVRGLVATDK